MLTFCRRPECRRGCRSTMPSTCCARTLQQTAWRHTPTSQRKVHNSLSYASCSCAVMYRALHLSATPDDLGSPPASATSNHQGCAPGVFPNSLTAAVRACKHGVKRTHVIYAKTPGALLVELYSRDGLGVMVSGAPLATSLELLPTAVSRQSVHASGSFPGWGIQVRTNKHGS